MKRTENAKIGGKAQVLNLLKSAGYPIKKFITLNTEMVEKIIKEQRVPCDLLKKIKQSLHFSNIGVAVRSAAVGEDGTLSWAGQFKTKLFVSFDKLAEAILECANAQNCDSVISYAQTHNTSVPKLALMVQEMVDAQFSGVLFTTDPRKYSEEIIIEAISGVGEDLVSGLRQPSRYFINFTTCELVKQEHSAEKLNISLQQILTMARLGKKIYEFFGKHQDIEWAIERGTGKIYLNQSRDITTRVEEKTELLDETKSRVASDLKTKIATESKRLKGLGVVTNYDIVSDQNIAEIITPHPYQMSFGLFTYLFAHGDGAIKEGRNEMGYNIGQELKDNFFLLIGGQPRCSIIHDAFTYRIKGVPLNDYELLIQKYLEMIEENPQLANYPEIALYEQNPSLAFLVGLFGKTKGDQYYKAYRNFFSNFEKIEQTLDVECQHNFIPQWRNKIMACKDDLNSSDINTMTVKYREVSDLLRSIACKMFVKVARVGFFSYARLLNTLKELFGGQAEKYLNDITAGTPLDLNPNLRFSVELTKLRDEIASMDEVMSEFGHLAIHELEISIPRYHDQPDFVLELANQIGKNPLEEHKLSLIHAEELEDRVLSKASSMRKRLASEIAVAKRYLPLREVVKFEFTRGYDILRTLAMNIEEKLGWEDGLIFYLDPREIFVLAKNNQEEYHKIALSRRLSRKQERALYIPPVINTRFLDDIGKPPDLNESILKGIGVTNIVTEGDVVVVRSSDDLEAISHLKKGSILVTETTNPAWSTLLSIVGSKGGLVTEIGGMLAHGAIYAREVGMAAVLNIPQATHILKTGMRVRVNGAQGYVEIMNHRF